MLVSNGRRWKTRRGGTVVNVLTAVVFFGLIGAGLWWIVKTAGQAGQQCSEAMIGTTDKATTSACQARCAVPFFGLREKGPHTLAELEREHAVVSLSRPQRRDLRVRPGLARAVVPDERPGLRTERRTRWSM
jgi:hypothetical protein